MPEQLQRIYSDWSAVKAASGTPGSRKRKLWREVLRTRPAIAYWGDSWFSTPLYKNLCWNSFARIDGLSLRLGGPGLTAAKMLTAAACRENAERLAAREFDLVCLSIGGNDALGARLSTLFDGAPRMDADAAFRRLLDAQVFARLRERYHVALSALAAVGGGFRVVGHGYARLQKIGDPGKTSIKNLGLLAPLVGNVGPWLWPAMKGTLGSKAEARRFADLLLVDGECTPRHAIEYQGSGHHQGTAAARDAIKKEALRRAGVGYYEVLAGRTTPAELRLLVEKLVAAPTE